LKENPRTPYTMTIRLIEADRISTPESMSGESESKDVTGGCIIDGVEIDREGTVVRYHIASRHPLSETSIEEITWAPIDAIGKETGYPNMLHVMTHERPEQRRGVSFVAAQIEMIKQRDRYITSEIAANVVSSMLSVFITTEVDDGLPGLEDAVNENEKVTNDDFKIELAPGAIYELPPGKTIKDVNPIRNNSTFDSFVSAADTIIGASMEIPKEVLTKKYERSYTAARGAIMDFWRTVTVYRQKFIFLFCRPIYEQWLAEAVAIGRIQAPGFFDDPAIRQAWSGSNWMGSSMGHVDPLKEVKAAAERIKNNISTEEAEAIAFDGADWNAVIRQRKKELTALAGMDDEKKGEKKNAKT